MKHYLYFLVSVAFVLCQPIDAAEGLKDFKGTAQKVALVGLATEFVDQTAAETVTNDIRKFLNRFTSTFDTSAVSNFKLGSNAGNQYFRPVRQNIETVQKEYLNRAAKDNSFDIAVLGVLRENPQGLEIELQLFDSRTGELSAIETQSFRLDNRSAPLEEVTYRLMNYIDQAGFVHPSSQDFLQKPISAMSGATTSSATTFEEDEGLDPEEFNQAGLRGPPTIAGEQTPFWERWWFWTAIAGTLMTAGGLSYYFFVVDQPPTQTAVDFEFSN